MDERKWNRDAWDRNVALGNRWTVPVEASVIQRARAGDWQVLLTSNTPVPRDWFPAMAGCRVLCLAGAGGQQAPIMAAAGACVTVLDNSPKQLEQDKFVADREGLDIECIEGDMTDLSRFDDRSFGLIVHPCSNCFVRDVHAVWRESYRVLCNGGCLLSGVVNSLAFLFSDEDYESGNLTVTQPLPWYDADHLDNPDVARRVAVGETLEFGHTLQDLVGGQVKAGFSITGFYEDGFDPDSEVAIGRFSHWMIATRAVKRA
jgi:SAM-dependent methyltransferase